MLFGSLKELSSWTGHFKENRHRESQVHSDRVWSNSSLCFKSQDWMLSYLIGFFVIKSHLLTVSELLLAESVQMACGLLDDLPWLSTGKTDFHGMVSFTSTIECSISSFTNTIFSFCIDWIYFFFIRFVGNLLFYLFQFLLVSPFLPANFMFFLSWKNKQTKINTTKQDTAPKTTIIATKSTCRNIKSILFCLSTAG